MIIMVVKFLKEEAAEALGGDAKCLCYQGIERRFTAVKIDRMEVEGLREGD